MGSEDTGSAVGSLPGQVTDTDPGEDGGEHSSIAPEKQVR